MPAIASLRWMAPEAISGSFVFGSDVWSFGIIIYEFVARKKPHADSDIFDLPLKIMTKGVRPKIPKNTKEALAELMDKCWNFDAEFRPHFRHICEMLRNLKLMFASNSHSLSSLTGPNEDSIKQEDKSILSPSESESQSQNYEFNFDCDSPLSPKIKSRKIADSQAGFSLRVSRLSNSRESNEKIEKDNSQNDEDSDTSSEESEKNIELANTSISSSFKNIDNKGL
eukprot:TRINITY_DN5515_c0_g1_i1.p1 TRINITY_DN5515_c0_g1~~TRINITY_DN5515_c0_g1_i1.p1  ORF type:complete len:226 (-),score=36.07 TRINITY_DN5515_c0_g1_i1:47-724(-)